MAQRRQMEKREMSNAFLTTKVQIRWLSENLKLSDTYLPVSPTAVEFATLVLSFQVAYEEMSYILELPPHALKTESVTHPNMSLSFSGIAESISAFSDLVSNLPELIVALCLVPARVKNESVKLAIDTEMLALYRDCVSAYKEAPDHRKREYLRQYYEFRASDKDVPVRKARVVEASIPRQEEEKEEAPMFLPHNFADPDLDATHFPGEKEPARRDFDD
jgi:hypothetical protein